MSIHSPRVIFLKLIQVRILRFVFSGCVAAITDLVVLFVLVHLFNLYYLSSSIIAFLCGLAVSFLMQKYFTFNDYTRDRIRRQTVLYSSFHALNLCLNTLLMYVGVDLLHIPYLISQIIIAGLLAISNFFTSKHLVFKSVTCYDRDTT